MVGNVDDDPYNFQCVRCSVERHPRAIFREEVRSFIMLSELLVSLSDHRPPCISYCARPWFKFGLPGVNKLENDEGMDRIMLGSDC